jgi:hypothetical protein
VVLYTLITNPNNVFTKPQCIQDIFDTQDIYWKIAWTQSRKYFKASFNTEVRLLSTVQWWPPAIQSRTPCVGKAIHGLHNIILVSKKSASKNCGTIPILQFEMTFCHSFMGWLSENSVPVCPIALRRRCSYINHVQRCKVHDWLATWLMWTTMSCSARISESLSCPLVEG